MLRRALLASLVALSGCASQNPDLYALSIVPGTPQPGGPKLVVLHDIGLARYLERLQIVRSSEDYRLNVRSNDWWGEPLGGMLGRVLVEELSQRLPGTSVFAEAGAITSVPDAVLEVNIQRMDAGSDGVLVLAAQVAVSQQRGRRNDRNTAVRLSVPIAGTDTRSAVAAMSTAVGQLADRIAAMLRG
jgi:uncharacterized lipoprotein YmbA